jgi:copper(I)-binding protein
VKKLPASDTTATSTATAPAVSAPQATTPTPTTPKTADVPTPGSVTVGDLTVSHARVVYKKDHLDFFCSIKNISNADERLGGAGTPLSTGDVVMVTKDKDGKETEAPVGIILTADKTVDLSTDTSWIRIKDVKSEPKSSEIVPVTLYFRRSPNAVLKLTLSGSEGSSLLDWFKK